MNDNPTNKNQANSVFELLDPAAIETATASQVHIYGDGFVCDIEPRAIEQDGAEIFVDASDGFIPLWKENTTLRWRFQDRSFLVFQNPEAAKIEIKRLFDNAFLAWDDAVPIQFEERSELADFEIVFRRNDDCVRNNCVLAAAFFPNESRANKLEIYPRMLEQTEAAQINTLVHEMGHIFGLRHFFAKTREAFAPSELFGVNRATSIMNYGRQSQLTADDKADLKRLYELVWSGELTEINRVPVKLMNAFHTTV